MKVEIKEKIEEYVNLEIRQKQIIDSLDLSDSIALFFALGDKGMKP